MQADAAAVDARGLTPLHSLAFSPLRGVGDKGDACDGDPTPAGRPATARPFYRDSVEGIADRLLGAGAGVDPSDRGGNTPLLAAAWSGCAELCAMLLARGADAGVR